MQIPPSSYLSDYIKHYLILDVESNVQKKFRHFSNGHSGIVFTIRKKDFRILDTMTTLPDTYIFGQISKNQDFIIDGSVTIIIVLFQPFGLYGFTGMPSNELQNKIVDSSLIFGIEVLELNKRLKSMFSIQEMMEYLNMYFINKLKDKKYVIAPFLQSTIQLVFSTKGIVSVNELSSYACSSERKLERTFSHQIGISPQKFLLNVRLHSFLGSLEKKTSFVSLTSLSLQAGYYDQAHLIRQFKKTTGITPSTYLKIKSLAVNLIELR